MEQIILKEDPETIIKQDEDEEFLVKVKVEEDSEYDEELREEQEKIITDDEEFVVEVKVEENSDEELDEEQSNSNVKTELKVEFPLDENDVEEGINDFNHPIQQEHKCFKCERVFEIITDLDKHLHECLLRKITNSKKSSLKNNSKTGTSMKSNQKPSTPGTGEIIKNLIYVCWECSREYKYKHGLKEHWKAVHGGQNQKPYSCPICSKPFYRPSEVKRHLLTHEQKTRKKFTCELATCPSSFTSAEKLRRHVQWMHERDSLPYKCEKCDARFSFKCRLVTHKLLKHGNDVVGTIK